MEAKNTFEKMLVSDSSPFNAPANVLTAAQNVELLSNGTNEFILQNLNGNEFAGNLSDGFIPIGVGSYGNVAYIVSYNPTTSQTEIGSFPSPDYTVASGQLQDVYGPLRNFKQPDGSYGAFRSVKFGYSLARGVRVEVQPTFDRTVNLVLQDGASPELMINTRFSVLANGSYKIEDRSGIDSNLYDETAFGATLNLFERSTYLMGADFLGLQLGGSVRLGNYRFFFKYATQDGNETDVLAETNPISVTVGTTPNTLRGGKANEPSDKRIALKVTNLDPAYPFLRVYYAYATGDADNVVLAYQVKQLYPVNGARELDILFSGTEESLPVGTSTLSISSVTIDHFEGMTQVNKQLVLVGGTEKSRDTEALAEYARFMTLGHKEAVLAAPGGTNYQNALSGHNTEDLHSTATVPGTIGAVGGYLNSYNSYKFTGYMGGEASPFVAAFIFPDGTLSPGYPLVGVDNLYNNRTIRPTDAGFLQRVQQINDEQSGWNSVEGINTRGVYRFPNRNAPGISPLLQNQQLSIFGVTVEFPPISNAAFQKIKQFTLGVQIFRGERKADAVAQGWLIPTVAAPKDEAFPFRDHVDGAYFSQEANVKYVPALRGGLESYHRYDGTDKPGLWPNWFYDRFTWGTPIISDKKFAFLSCEALGNPTRMSEVFNRRVSRKLNVFGKVTSYGDGQVLSEDGANDTEKLVPSVYMAHTVSPETRIGTRTAALSWVQPFDSLFNQDKFSSHAAFLAKIDDDTKNRIEVNFNSYAGVTFGSSFSAMHPENLLAISAASEGGANGEQTAVGFGQGKGPYYTAYAANVYAGSGQRTTDDVGKAYGNISTILYTPISPRLYWDTSYPGATAANSVEGQLDAQRRMTLFGGDCYVATAMRRIYTNGMSDTTQDTYNLGVGVTMQLCQESTYNPAWRHPQTEDQGELFDSGHDRTFAPFIAQEGNPYDWDTKANPYRKLRLPETSGSNRGYGYRSSAVLYVPDSPESPFRATSHPNRVYVTEPYNPGAFINGYRMLLPLASRDYNVELGPVVSAHSVNGQLVLVHEKGITSMGLNERAAAAKDSNGIVYIEPGSTLPPAAHLDSSEFGSTWKFGTCVSDSYVYGVDVASYKIWQRQGEKVELISDQAVQGYLKRWVQLYQRKGQQILTTDVRSIWDKNTGKVYFTFYSRNPDEQPGKEFSEGSTFTLIYSETLKVWNCHFSYKALLYFRALDSLYSFPLLADNSYIYKHEVQFTKAGLPNCGVFAGEQHDAYFEFIVRNGDDPAVFHTLEMLGSAVYPATVELSTVEGTYVQKIVHERRIRTDNADYRKGKLYIQLQNRLRRSRHEEQYLRVRIIYQTTEKVFINLIKTLQNGSYS